MINELREQFQSSPAGPAATQYSVAGAATSGETHRTAGPAMGPQLTAPTWTLALTGNPADLPPQAIQHLRCTSFQAPRTRTKGDYYPPQAHQLAAHRLYETLSTHAGAYTTPMSFVLQLRELDCVRFEVNSRVLMALYSSRLGNRGLTIMHFRPLTEMEQLRRGSMNVKFSADFGAEAVLPTATPQCEAYDDLLAAISELMSMGDALFFGHVRRLTSRLKRFVLANLERYNNTPERVTLTLLYVNTLPGRATSHLSDDSPEWWRNYSEAVRAIDYHAADWQASLNGLALRLAAQRAAATEQSSQPPRGAPPSSRRANISRVLIMPDHVRRQIPRHADGMEPCLRFLSGGMCYGGSAERCAHARRTHSWDRRLPRDLQEFIDRHYRQGRGPRQDSRQQNQ